MCVSYAAAIIYMKQRGQSTSVCIKEVTRRRRQLRFTIRCIQVNWGEGGPGTPEHKRWQQWKRLRMSSLRHRKGHDFGW